MYGVGGRTFRDDDVEPEDLQGVQGLHDVRVRVSVFLRSVRCRERARRKERVARLTEVRDGSRPGILR